MKQNRRLLLLCLAIPLAVGALSAWISGSGMAAFAELNQPPLSPPGWLFPVVWTILYLMMGLASWLVLTSGKPRPVIKSAMQLYALQLGFNFFWSIIFFGLSLYLTAFLWLVVLWLLIIATTIRFYRIREPAGYLMIPYLLWVTFAGYLNLAIALIN